jgi:hypothetical protein
VPEAFEIAGTRLWITRSRGFLAGQERLHGPLKNLNSGTVKERYSVNECVQFHLVRISFPLLLNRPSQWPPCQVVVFHYDMLGADDPPGYSRLPGWSLPVRY